MPHPFIEICRLTAVHAIFAFIDSRKLKKNRYFNVVLLILYYSILGPLWSSAQIISTPLHTLSTKLSAEQIYQKNHTHIFRLITHVQNGKDGSSHGSAFVVDQKNGLLMTNYHVIADRLLFPEKYLTQLELNSESLPADIVAVDPINDLAIIKVQKNFESQVTLARSQPINPGSTVYSMGYPQSERLSIIQGNFNGSHQRGFSKVTATSMPLNSGMSGGPSFNDLGEVIGVNRAILLKAQNISYLSPLTAITALMKRSSQQSLKIKTHTDLKQDIVRHVKAYESFKPHRAIAQQTKEHHVNGLYFSFPFQHLNCGQDKDSDKNLDYFLCTNESFSLLSHAINAVSFETYATSHSDERLIQLSDAILDQKIKKIESGIQSMANRGLATVKTQSSNNMQFCNIYKHSNKNHISFVTKICSVSIPQFDGLYATFVKTDALTPQKKRVHFSQVFEGLSLQKTTEALNHFWNSIYEK